MNAAEIVGGPSTEEDASAGTTTRSCPTRPGCETTHQKNRSTSRHSPTKHRFTAHLLPREPTSPHKRPADSRLHLTTLCPGRLYTPPVDPGSPASYHRDHPQSPHSIPAEARDSIPNPAPRRRDLDAWLAISPGRAGYSRPCALQTRVAVARTPSVRPRRHRYNGPPPVATPPRDRSRESPALV